jgi:hypothetical protein
MTNHIGIVACSAEGAALCYRTICTEGAQLLGPHAHPEVSMHTHSLADYIKCIERGDWPGVGNLMLSSAHKPASVGADFLICPDNTIHQALPYVERQSPLPRDCWHGQRCARRCTVSSHRNYHVIARPPVFRAGRRRFVIDRLRSDAGLDSRALWSETPVDRVRGRSADGET